MRVVTAAVAIAALVAGGDVAARAVLGCDLVTLAERAGAHRPPSRPAVVPRDAPPARGRDVDLVRYTCADGVLDATAVAPWYVNADAPWKWTSGEARAEKISLDRSAARFKGARCEGTLKAFVCDGQWCKGPIAIAVD